MPKNAQLWGPLALHIMHTILQFAYLDSNVHICDLREHLRVGGVEPLLLERCLSAALAAEHVEGQQGSADLGGHDAHHSLD